MSDLTSRHSRKNNPLLGLCPWPWYFNCFPVPLPATRCTAAYASNRFFNYIIIAFRSQTPQFNFNYSYRGLIYIRNCEEGGCVLDGWGTSSQMARYLSIMLYCLSVTKLDTCTDCAVQRGKSSTTWGTVTRNQGWRSWASGGDWRWRRRKWDILGQNHKDKVDLCELDAA